MEEGILFPTADTPVCTWIPKANIQTRNRASWIEHIKEPITSTDISLTKMHYPAESISFFHCTIQHFNSKAVHFKLHKAKAFYTLNISGGAGVIRWWLLRFQPFLSWNFQNSNNSAIPEWLSLSESTNQNYKAPSKSFPLKGFVTDITSTLPFSITVICTPDMFEYNFTLHPAADVKQIECIVCENFLYVHLSPH